ncbi:AcrR family transcriptional regulator [Nakamurella sp. UYEF19]|uniref:TetR/AcrR family transcriptional regulator C-terminal domain-containing protein n=1 Tax=Nakamurella sp. UYEF19 TaxID=1756392 RepID=UPI003391D841
MSQPISSTNKERVPLSLERVLTGAITVADAGGIGALTIRTLAQQLGVKPMSVYHYVANKDEIIDGIVDLVYAEFDLPVPGEDWRTEMQRRAGSARRVLANHPWATPLLQSRLNPGPATLRHHDAFIATLRAAGFSVELTAHAFALIDSYVFGFALSENALPIHGPDSVADTAASMMHFFDAEAYPALLEFTMKHVMRPDYDFGAEFQFGLDLILDGLARPLRDNGSAPPVRPPGRPRRPPKARSGTPSGG